MNYLYLFIISLTLIACNQNDTNEVEDLSQKPNVIYQDTVIGWSIEVPAIWQIQTQEQIAAINEKGVASTEAAVGSKMDVNLLKNAFGFTKDSANMFQSIHEIYDGNEADWKTHNADLKELFCTVYANQGARLDSSETTVSEIGGVKFQSYEILFYDNDENINMVQIFYSALLDGRDFSVSMCVTDEQNRRELSAIWENSTFIKPE